jgi:hypothetical protein
MWTDENGVKHITNILPPEGAEILMRTAEIPYDEEADKERKESEQLAKAIAARQEIIELEAQLIEVQRNANRRIENANQKARDALEYGEYWKRAAQENYYGFSGTRIRYFGHYPDVHHHKKPHLNRWYYRHKDKIRNKPSHDNYRKGHHKNRHFKKSPNTGTHKGRRTLNRHRYQGSYNQSRYHRSKSYGYRSRGSGMRNFK